MEPKPGENNEGDPKSKYQKRVAELRDKFDDDVGKNINPSVIIAAHLGIPVVIVNKDGTETHVSGESNLTTQDYIHRLYSGDEKDPS